MNGYHDLTYDHRAASLTMGVPVDCTSFFELLKRAVCSAEQQSAPVLVLIELAGLREVGNGHGPARQRLLAEAAAVRVAEALASNGYVCALRDHRLAALIASDGQPSPDALASRLLASLAVPVEADGVVLAPGARLGMAKWDQDGVTVDELFVAADVAMHPRAAKSAPAAPNPAPFRFVASPLALRA